MANERYTDPFVRCVPEDSVSQGLHVKIPGVDEFFPLLGIEIVPENPRILHVTISADNALPAPPELSNAHYFVHESQIVFRMMTFVKKVD
jgi:hypothetical protein